MKAKPFITTLMLEIVYIVIHHFPFRLYFLNDEKGIVTLVVPDWKVHHRVQLVPPAAVVGESLQVDDQDAWQ